MRSGLKCRNSNGKKKHVKKPLSKLHRSMNRIFLKKTHTNTKKKNPLKFKLKNYGSFLSSFLFGPTLCDPNERETLFFVMLEISNRLSPFWENKTTQKLNIDETNILRIILLFFFLTSFSQYKQLKKEITKTTI